MEKIGIVSRGDIVRAVRQCMADEKIDLAAIAKEAVESAVEKRLGYLDISEQLKKHACEVVSKDLWNLRDTVAKEVGRRIALAPPSA